MVKAILKWVERGLIAATAIACTGLSAQTYTTITASKVQNGFGTLLSAGTMCFSPFNSSGALTPITPVAGSPSTGPFCGAVNTGVISLAGAVPNLATASPSGLNYQVTIYNVGGAVVGQLTGVTAVSGTAWSYDAYAILPSIISGQPSASGIGSPYLTCSVAASYTRTDSTPMQNWACATTPSGFTQWASNGTIPPVPGPNQSATVPVVNQMIQDALGHVTGAVVSFKGRAGAVVPATGDYTFPQVGGTVASGQLPPFTPAMVAAAGTLSNPTTGNAATSTNLDHTPNACPIAGQKPNGVDAGGNAVGCSAAGGGGAPHTPAKSVQIANAGVNGSDSDPNILIDTSIHQHQITGPGSQSIGVTNPTTGYAQTSNNVYNDTRNSPNDFPRNAYFGGTGGMNYGNGPGVAGPDWTTGGMNFWNANFSRRGITQFLSGGINKRATGDYAFLYANQVYGVGGITGASDEGGVGDKRNGGEISEVYSGTATAGAATGSTTLPISSGNTCDGCFMYDASKPGPSGKFTGGASFVALTANAGYWSEPIDTAVTPSTAYGIPACTLPQLTDQNVPQTVSCTISGALGSTGVFANGIASISGPFAEQVSITASAPSGGSQTVAITYRNPHVSGHFILWQGGTAQGMVQSSPNEVAISGGFPNGQTVFGAPDSTHLAAGVALGGVETSPLTDWARALNLVTITKSGGIATAHMNDTAELFIQFADISSAIIAGSAGCSGGSMDGTVTAVTISYTNSTVSWTDASSSTGCTSATIGLPTAIFAYQLYPYAEQIAAGDISTQATLEPNKVPWAAGDSIAEPHPPTFGYNGVWHGIQSFHPHGRVQSTGIFQTFQGIGIGGNQDFLRLTNLNSCNQYQGCGGQMNIQPWLKLEGPNGGTILSTVPVDSTKAMMTFNCPVGFHTSPGVAGNCSDLEKVLLTPMGNVTIDGVTGWNFTGAGIHTAGIGTFDNGINSKAGRFVVGNQGQTTIDYGAFGTALLLNAGFNNGGPAADIEWTITGFGETGRWSSDLAFGNITNMNGSVGGVNFIRALNTGGAISTTLPGAVSMTNASVLASNTVNDIAYFDNATGHLADSGRALSTIPSLGASNVWTGPNQYNAGLNSLGLLQTSSPSNATGGANFAAPNFQQSGQYWDGAASQSDIWSWIETLGAGTNPTSTYTLTHSGTPGALAVRFPIIGTTTNCSSAASPAVCGSAASGSVVIAAAATTVVVNTTAVTANSQIQITPDSSLSTKLGVTCNSTLATSLAGFGVTARVAGTSFTITTLGTVTTNPACYSYTIIN